MPKPQANTPLPSRILALLATEPGLSDREITDRLLGSNSLPQSVNQACPALEQAGRLRRTVRMS